MNSKMPWIVAAVMTLGVVGCGVFAITANNHRKSAEAAQAKAEASKQEADAAAEKALAARQLAETESAQLDAAKKALGAQLAATQASLVIAQQQVDLAQKNAAKQDAEIAATRLKIAESERARDEVARTVAGGSTPPKQDPPKAPAPPSPVATAPIPAPPVAPRPAGSWSVPELLPADTLLMVSMRDVPSMLAKEKETGLYKILTHPDVAEVFRKQIRWARGAQFWADALLRENTTEMLDFLQQGEITFAILSLDKRGPNGQPIPDLLLAVELRGKADKFMEKFNKRLDQLKAATNGNLNYTESRQGETKITHFTHPDFPATVSTALCDGTFLICIGEGRIGSLLTMREKMKLPGAKNADAAAGAPEVLAQLPTYKKALEKAGPGADLIAFVNIDAGTRSPILNDPNKQLTPTQKHELDVSGLKEVKAFSYAVGIKDGALRETLFLDVPAAQRKGLLGLFEGEGADWNAFYAAPRNSVLAWTFKIDMEQLLKRIVAILELENPDAGQNVAVALMAFGQQYNIDIQKELFGSLTGQGVLSVTVPYKNAKLPIAFPQPIVALRMKDAAGVKHLLKTFAAAGAEKFEFAETPESGKTITIARQREHPEEGIHEFCYVIDGDDLLLSINALALREEIRRRAGTTGRLEDDPNFNIARASMTGQPQSMLYIDASAVGSALYGTLMPLIQAQGREAQIDLNAMPTADVLAQNMGASLMDLHLAPDGILMESYSPTGVFSLALPIIAARRAAEAKALAAEEQAAQANGAAPTPAAAVQPRSEIEKKKVATLEKLARDLKEYSAEHGGAYPGKLDEMRPKYLQDIGKEITDIVYLGKQAADNRVVAHSSEKLGGNYAVLLQNGSIQTILRHAFPGVLRDGFVETPKEIKKDVNKDTNKAVKPPRPPEF